jgi:hypothetical protein
VTTRTPISPTLVAELRARDSEYRGHRQDRVPQIDPAAARLVAARWAAQRHAEIEQRQREMEDLIVRCCIGFCPDCDRPLTTPALRRLHPEFGEYGMVRVQGYGRCSTCYDRHRTSDARPGGTTGAP